MSGCCLSGARPCHGGNDVRRSRGQFRTRGTYGTHDVPPMTCGIGEEAETP
jgi:hypothetical protein